LVERKSLRGETSTVAQASSTEAVVWKNGANVTVSGSALSKSTSAPVGFWNAGASSSRALASGYGHVRFTAFAHSNSIVGLSNGDSNQAWADVDFGAYLTAEGQVWVVEGLSYFGPYASPAVEHHFFLGSRYRALVPIPRPPRRDIE
jgi:hypothetical protein